MSEINKCNVTINGEEYYNPDISSAGKTISNVLSIGWNFVNFLYALCCCISCVLILIIMISNSAPKSALNFGSVIIGLITLFFCLWASYSFYYYNVAQTELASESKKLSESKTSRPCQSSTTGKIFT